MRGTTSSILFHCSNAIEVEIVVVLGLEKLGSNVGRDLLTVVLLVLVWRHQCFSFNSGSILQWDLRVGKRRNPFPSLDALHQLIWLSIVPVASLFQVVFDPLINEIVVLSYVLLKDDAAVINFVGKIVLSDELPVL